MNSPVRLIFSAQAEFGNKTDAGSPSRNYDANLPFLEAIIFCCLQVISEFFSFTRNLLVLAAIYRTRQLQIVSNIFITLLGTAHYSERIFKSRALPNGKFPVDTNFSCYDFQPWRSLRGSLFCRDICSSLSLHC